MTPKEKREFLDNQILDIVKSAKRDSVLGKCTYMFIEDRADQLGTEMDARLLRLQRRGLINCKFIVPVGLTFSIRK